MSPGSLPLTAAAPQRLPTEDQLDTAPVHTGPEDKVPAGTVQVCKDLVHPVDTDMVLVGRDLSKVYPRGALLLRVGPGLADTGSPACKCKGAVERKAVQGIQLAAVHPVLPMFR